MDECTVIKAIEGILKIFNFTSMVRNPIQSFQVKNVNQKIIYLKGHNFNTFSSGSEVDVIKNAITTDQGRSVV